MENHQQYLSATEEEANGSKFDQVKSKAASFFDRNNQSQPLSPQPVKKYEKIVDALNKQQLNTYNTGTLLAT